MAASRCDPICGADGDRLAATTFIAGIATTGGLAPPNYFWKKTGS